MGEAVRGAVDEVGRAPFRRDTDADWFSALGYVAQTKSVTVTLGHTTTVLFALTRGNQRLGAV